MLQQICRLFDSLSITADTLNLAYEPYRKMFNSHMKKFFEIIFLVSHIATFEYLSPEDTIVALKDGVNCLSHLIQIVEPLISIHRNITLQ